MILKKLACSLVLFALSTTFLSAQTVQPKKPTDDPEALKKDAVAFLRETMADVNNLRTLENRISFSAELAGLMWFHDEKEARSLYVSAFGNFKELLIQYDQQMNNLSKPAAEGEQLDHSPSGGMFADVTDRQKLSKRFRMAMEVRQQIAMSLAEHDADLAFSFYFDSITAITNPEFRAQMESRDEFFEAQLMTQIARSNVAKATQFAVKSVSSGLNYQHLDLLQKIYDKDPDKGAELASAMLSKVKSESVDSGDFWIVGSFLGAAGASYEKTKSDSKKKPMLGQSDLRDLADALGQGVMSSDVEYANGLQYLDDIEKYSPAKAAQIKRKYKKVLSGGETASFGNTNASYRYGNSATNSLSMNSNIGITPDAEDLAREKAEKEFEENVGKLADKQLPKAEREKIVAQARRILLRTAGKDKKIVGLSALAGHVARAGDKELAAEIMKDAQALVNPQPKNYQDFLLTWMLASGYAESEPEKAYPLLEDTIGRANDTIAAFVKVGEFIDVAGEMIDEGEIRVGAFGGSVIRGLTTELGMADSTLRTLAKADFKKTRDLTSRFDRSEVRILAKMMILRAVLGEEKQKKTDAAVEVALSK